MVLTDDQTVIVIPLSIPSNITYSAKTLGVKSQCATYVVIFLKNSQIIYISSQNYKRVSSTYNLQ